jgi:glycosyltransferase involved in cell wall biosynthesis
MPAERHGEWRRQVADEAKVIKVTNPQPQPWIGGRYRIDPGQTIEVPWEFLSAFPPSKRLVYDLSGARANLRTHDAEGRQTFDFWLPISSVDGYGRHALAIYEGLKGLGVNPVLHDVGWGNDFKPRQYAMEAEINNGKLPCRAGLVMSVPYDEGLTAHSSVYKIVITQFETNRVPDFHVKAVNKADHLIVTSKFQPDIWRASGLRKSLPISVMTAGIDTDYFAYRRPEKGRFRVLMLGALTGRKDPLAAIRIFQEASEGRDWQFTIKTRNAAGLQGVLQAIGVNAQVAKRMQGMGPDVLTIDGKGLEMPYRVVGKSDPRIEVIISDDPPDSVRDYYQSHDCLLWPSKAEGVGLPPLEAMSCGMEVVMSTNSGMADYAFESHCWPMRGAGTEPADGPGGFSDDYLKAFGSVGSWWLVDASDGVRQLRNAFKAWDRGEGKGAKAAAYVRTHHTLALQARSVLDVMEQYG